MTSRLGAIIAADLPTVFADFGESVTYTPRGGVARSLYAITEYASEEDIIIESVLETENEHLWVTVQTAQTDATYGGVALPNIGDTVQRSEDSADALWFFAGQKEGLPGAWRMAFWRRRVTRLGPRQ